MNRYQILRGEQPPEEKTYSGTCEVMFTEAAAPANPPPQPPRDRPSNVYTGYTNSSTVSMATGEDLDRLAENYGLHRNGTENDTMLTMRLLNSILGSWRNFIGTQTSFTG